MSACWVPRRPDGDRRGALLEPSREALLLFDSDVRVRMPAYQPNLQLATAAIASARPAGSLLSVGCGSGQDVLHLARDPAYHITAIDPPPDMVALAATRFRELGVERLLLQMATPAIDVIRLPSR